MMTDETREAFLRRTAGGQQEARHVLNRVPDRLDAPAPKVMSSELHGLLLLIMHFPSGKVVKLEANDSWLLIDLQYAGGVWCFAVWRHTGNVYRVNEQGAVDDEPLIMVTTKPVTRVHIR